MCERGTRTGQLCWHLDSRGDSPLQQDWMANMKRTRLKTICRWWPDRGPMLTDCGATLWGNNLLDWIHPFKYCPFCGKRKREV